MSHRTTETDSLPFCAGVTMPKVHSSRTPARRAAYFTSLAAAATALVFAGCEEPGSAQPPGFNGVAVDPVDVLPDRPVGIDKSECADACPGEVEICDIPADGVLFSSTAASNRFSRALAVGDVNNDGSPDYLGASGAGSDAGGLARMVSGADGSVLWSAVSPRDDASSVRWWAYSLAAGGDVNGDGSPDVLIGGGYDLAAYDAQTGTQHFAIQPETFRELAFVGDIDGDGADDFLGGSYTADGYNGRAALYSGATGTYLKNADGTDRFVYEGSDFERAGSAVVSAGDLNGDGVTDLLVGSYRARRDSSSSRVGRLQAFSGADGSLLSTVWGYQNYAGFGWSLANLGDINADGVDDFVASNPWREWGSAPNNSGAVNLWSGATWTRVWREVGDTAGAALGYSVANVGDFDGDGINDFAAGEPYANGNAGGVRVYSGSTRARLATWEADSGDTMLGGKLASAGDYNGDGLSDVLIVNSTGTGPQFELRANGDACDNAIVCGGVGECAGADACGCFGGWSGVCCDIPPRTIDLYTDDAVHSYYLANQEGHALYVHHGDLPSATGTPTSNCTGNCLDDYTPFAVETISLPDSLDASDFTTFVNAEVGISQVAFRGWPLYTAAVDTVMGDVNGHQVGLFHAATIDCAAGFTGNGIICTDVDECAAGTATCGDHSTCSNTEGAYTCDCDDGYESGLGGCVDVNECDTWDYPNQWCINNEGSFEWGCEPGYLYAFGSCDADPNPIQVSDDCSLEAALYSSLTDTASGGCSAGSGADTILLPAGAYGISFSQPMLSIFSDVTIIGDGPGETSIHLSQNRIGVQADATLSLSNLTVTGTTPNDYSTDEESNLGGAIRNWGTLVLTDVTLSDISTVSRAGGAIYNDGGMVTATRSVFRDNDAGTGAAIYSAGGSVNVVDSSFIDNHSTGWNQFFNGNGTFPITSGGAIWSSGTLNVEGSTFDSNFMGALTNVCFGSFGHGGAISAQNATISGSTFVNNSATGDGGALLLSGNAQVTDTTISGTESEITWMCGSSFQTYQGAAVYVGSGNSVLEGVLIDESVGSGLQTWFNATVELSESAIIGSSHRGLDVRSPGAVHATNVVLSGNQTGYYAAGTLQFDHSTIADNTELAGHNGTVSARNSIFAGSAGCPGSIQSDGYNYFDPNLGCTVTGDVDNQLGSDPGLGALVAHRGTWTHRLSTGSSAIDAGDCVDSTGDTTDIDHRGTARPQGATCDIGAFEYCGEDSCCPEGYENIDGVCTDVDECALETAGCDANAECTNVEGSAVCACEDGYFGDGFSCTTCSTCPSDQGVAEACTATVDTTCEACDAGYEGNGLTCEDIDECLADPCNGEDGISYLLDTTPLSFDDSQAACVSAGGTLAMPTLDEYDAVVTVSAGAPAPPWIGAKREVGGSFEWVDGTPYDLGFRPFGTPWSSSPEFCVSVPSDGVGNMADRCTSERPFICETTAAAVCVNTEGSFSCE